MPTDYSGVNNFVDPIALPSDGDNRNATTLNGALEGIVDRTAYLYSLLTGNGGGKITQNPVLSTYLTLDASVAGGFKFRTNVIPDVDFTIANDFYDFYLLSSPSADRNLVITAGVPLGRELFLGALDPLVTPDWAHTWHVYHTDTSPSNFLCDIQLGSMWPLAGVVVHMLGSGWTVRQPVYNRSAPALVRLADGNQVVPVGSRITTVIPSFSAPAADRTWTLPTVGVASGAVVIFGNGRTDAGWSNKITLVNSLCASGFPAILTSSPAGVVEEMQGGILVFDGTVPVWRVVSNLGNLP